MFNRHSFVCLCLLDLSVKRHLAVDKVVVVVVNNYQPELPVSRASQTQRPPRTRYHYRPIVFDNALLVTLASTLGSCEISGASARLRVTVSSPSHPPLWPMFNSTGQYTEIQCWYCWHHSPKTNDSKNLPWGALETRHSLVWSHALNARI